METRAVTAGQMEFATQWHPGPLTMIGATQTDSSQRPEQQLAGLILTEAKLLAGLVLAVHADRVIAHDDAQDVRLRAGAVTKGWPDKTGNHMLVDLALIR